MKKYQYLASWDDQTLTRVGEPVVVLGDSNVSQVEVILPSNFLLDPTKAECRMYFLLPGEKESAHDVLETAVKDENGDSHVTWTIKHVHSQKGGRLAFSLTLIGDDAQWDSRTAIIPVYESRYQPESEEAEKPYTGRLDALEGSMASIRGEFAEVQDDFEELKETATLGTPIPESLVANMTEGHIYIYTGTESGYTAGHVYYYVGGALTDGGVYGGTAVDATLTVSGQAADAKVTGDKIEEIKEDLTAVSPTPSLTWTLGKNIDETGNVSENKCMAVSDAIPASKGDLIIRKTPGAVNNTSLIGYVSEFNGSTFISRTNVNAYGQRYIVANSETTHIRLAFGRLASSGIEISQTDVDAYFKVEVFRKSVNSAEYNQSSLIMRGNIVSLGYTSANECILPGIYTFTTSDISKISNLPPDINVSGFIIVYTVGTVKWQECVSSLYRYIRYGTGVWLKADEFIQVVYNSDDGEDNSTEQINIDIRRGNSTNYIRYQMGHCVKQDVNSDVWRVMYLYMLNGAKSLQTAFTRRGEFECALRLDGRPDFSGGVVHGDEIDQNVAFFCDGKITDKANVTGFYKEFRIVRNSYLYDPNDNTTIIAEHGAEYIYTADGLTINQSIKWREALPLKNCFLAMLPILKAYSTYRYDDTNFAVIENTQTEYTVTIPNAKSVTEYCNDMSSTMSIPNYPTGLTGGDAARITDNGGESYNKVYFDVCTDESSSVGELWKSTTVYKII